MTGALPHAVLWDLDGTLVDTEPYWFAEEKALVAARGGRWGDDDARRLVGNSLTVAAQIMIDESGIEGDAADLAQRMVDGVTRRVAGHIPWRPGAHDLLMSLRERDVPCALVTMSYRSLAEAVREALPPGTFAALVTGDEVTYGKPHPEPYLTAAGLLGFAPQQCLAIEDSPPGVASAVAAGVPTLSVPHTVPVPVMRGAVSLPTLAGLSAYDLVGFFA